MQLRLLLGAAALGSLLMGCSYSGSSPMQPNHVANVASNVLQFAVGTANLYGTASGLNIVATYRQPANGYKPGDSGTLVNSPTLTLPAAIAAAPGSPAGYDATSTILTGPAPSEVGTASMTPTSQAPSSATVTSFGQSGGVFGYGIEPFNATGPNDATSPNNSGLPFQVAPYPVPLYAPAKSVFATNAFTPWGGPPAFDVVGNGTSAVGDSDFPGGTAGVPLGIDVFAGVTPTPGTYTLSINVPANSGAVNVSKTAAMPAGARVLGPATAPVAAFDGNGGASLAFVMPAGATEALVEVVDMGPTTAKGVSCNTASAASPVYYTVEMKAGGTATIGDKAGPSAAPSICTTAQNTSANKGTATAGDSILVYAVGFDYPFFESEYPASLKNPSPTITGAAGSDDITVSAPGSQTSP